MLTWSTRDSNCWHWRQGWLRDNSRRIRWLSHRFELNSRKSTSGTWYWRRQWWLRDNDRRKFWLYCRFELSSCEWWTDTSTVYRGCVLHLDNFVEKINCNKTKLMRNVFSTEYTTTIIYSHGGTQYTPASLEWSQLCTPIGEWLQKIKCCSWPEHLTSSNSIPLVPLPKRDCLKAVAPVNKITPIINYHL